MLFNDIFNTQLASEMKTEDQRPASIYLDTLLYRKGILAIRALNHPMRQEILKLIHQKGSVPVTEIFTKLRLEQSVASQQLGILRSAGYVETQREGKQIYYSIHYQMLEEANKVIKELVSLK